MNNENKTWVSAHLFYADPWEQLLATEVKPFVEKLFAEKLIDQFFFIRYWEHGPHIRLRLKTDHSLEQELRTRILERFNRYFEELPSSLQNYNRAKETDYPNNSVQFISYEPETDRYGGEFGIGLSEKLFEHSSVAVLDIISAFYKNWNYGLAMGFAIQMHLGFLLRDNKDPESIAEFLHYLVEGSIMHSLRAYREQPDYLERKQRLIDRFTQAYEVQKETILPVVHDTLGYLAQRNSGNEWLNRWVNSAGSILDELSQLNAEGKVQLSLYKNYSDIDRRKILWSIYHSYIHMTNNRLGLKVYDETFIAYILKCCLEEIALKSD